jgi:hypothetical protein
VGRMSDIVEDVKIFKEPVYICAYVCSCVLKSCPVLFLLIILLHVNHAFIPGFSISHMTGSIVNAVDGFPDYPLLARWCGCICSPFLA